MYRLYPTSCKECWRIPLQQNTPWRYGSQMIENIPSRYLLKRFKYSLVWLWMNLSVSWSTCYVVHSNPSEPKLIISNLMNESTYQLGSFNWHEDCWFILHLVLTMLKHICWDISYKKIVWFINKAYLPVYKWSRFFLQTGPPEVVQEVLADLKRTHTPFKN